MRPTELLLQYQRLGDRIRTLTDEARHIEQRLARDERVEAATAAVAEALEALGLLACQGAPARWTSTWRVIGPR